MTFSRDLLTTFAGLPVVALHPVGELEYDWYADPAAVSAAPVVARLTELDLSMGALGDEGAEALLSGQPLTHLARLDLHHHFIGEPMRERLRAALEPAGVEVDLSEPCETQEWGRYIAVSE